jgi:hypothetical protein
MMRAQRPLRAKFRARRVQEQQPRLRSLLDQQLDQLQGRGVGPMQILGRDYGWLHSGEPQRQLDQGGEQAAALLFG